MSNISTNWTLNLTDKISGKLQLVDKHGRILGDTFDKVAKKGGILGDCFKRIGAINLQGVNMAFDSINNTFNSINEPFLKFEANLKEVQAITGVTGEALDKLGDNARKTALQFGGDASSQLESYKIILSKLGPELGQSDEAMKVMGDNVQILSKTMGGDAIAAVNTLTTAMNQYGVDISDPIKATQTATDMMNIMASGAKYGAAELPAISLGLENVGGTAKLANLTFAETNAALQELNRGGKQGAEAGVALRNVLIKMQAPQALSKEALSLLQAHNVNLGIISDTTIPYAQRLKELSKIGNDATAMTVVFGAENMQAASIMLNTIGTQEELTQKIQGTNTATEQADIIMNSWQERIKRTTAWVDNLKISVGEYLTPLSSSVKIGSEVIKTMVDLGTIYSGLAPIYSSVMNSLRGVNIQSIIQIFSLRFWQVQLGSLRTKLATTLPFLFGFGAATAGVATAEGVATGTTFSLTGALRGMGIAIMSIPVIGWILAAITALVGVFAYLYSSSEKFRGIVWGVWYVIKMVFNKIWEFIRPVIAGIWEFIKLYFTTLWNFWSSVFSWIWNTVSSVFSWIWNIITTVITKVYNFLKTALASVLGVFKWAFGGVYNYVVNIFNKVYEKVMVFVNKIKEVFSKIKGWFSDATKEVSTAYKKGNEAGKEDFRKSKGKEKKEDKGVLAEFLGGDLGGINNGSSKGITGLSSGSGGGLKAEKGGGLNMGGGGGSGTANKTINQNIKIENHFGVNGEMDIKKAADKIARLINDNLSDGLAIA